MPDLCKTHERETKKVISVQVWVTEKNAGFEK